MTDEQRRMLRVRLELDLAATPIEGLLIDGDGVATRFTGWLGLASALEALQTAHDAVSEAREGDA